MSQGILFVGLEVDDKAYHAHLLGKHGDSSFEFVCKPNVATLIKKLKAYEEQGFELRICYEATYVGFSLQRKLSSVGFSCEIIASSLIPREPGRRVKTDRIDAIKLARYYKQGLLTSIYIPDEEQESVRDLVRSRSFTVEQAKSVKAHILSICRRYGLNYREAVDKKTASYWTQPHFQWLEKKTSEIERAALKTNLNTLLMTLRQLQVQIGTYDEEILNYSKTFFYEKSVQALCCYRGISTQIAMTLITEIGDPNRFDHPKRLTSYSGLDIAEKSSGATELRFSITRMGNRHLRTAIVEAAQSATKPLRISIDLKRRRTNAQPKQIEIADRCMKRLNKKGIHLLFAGKTKNKVTVACAREMLGFVWESLRAVA